MDTQQDKDFKAPDVENEDYSFQDKSGYVLLGLVIAAGVVAAVAIPVVLATK